MVFVVIEMFEFDMVFVWVEMLAFCMVDMVGLETDNAYVVW